MCHKVSNQVLLQNASRSLLQNAIALQQNMTVLLQITTTLSQNATVVTKCDVYYILRQYMYYVNSYKKKM